MVRPRCPDCNHTMKVHTSKAHNGKGGCAYCKCTIVAGAEVVPETGVRYDGLRYGDCY